MPSHTRRGAFVRDPWYTDCFVLAGAVRRLLLLLLLLSVFIRTVGVSVRVSIKLGQMLLALAVDAVGRMSCGSTDCLSCRGKQSTSSSSSSGRSLLFSILLDLFFWFSVAGVSVGDSIRQFRLGARGEGGLIGGCCHGMPRWFGWDRHRKCHGCRR